MGHCLNLDNPAARSALPDLPRDHLAELRHRAAVFGHAGPQGSARVFYGCLRDPHRPLPLTQRYLEEARPVLSQSKDPRLTDDPDERTLFLGDRGRPWQVKYLSAMVAAHVRAAEIGKEGSCHLFRHTCATLMLENGADIRYIQQLLGRACLAATEVYTQVSICQLKEVHTRTHPAKMPGAKSQEQT
jgi:hypothetical protein